MQVFFEHYGEGPWTCDECSETIVEIGQARMDGNVHHRDGDPTNDDPINLQPLHTVCHLRLHAPDEQMRQQISRKLKGRPSPTRGMKFSVETNAKKGRAGESNPYFGRHHSDEIRAKMRQPRKREVCSGCGREFAINWIRRHKCQI
jgi:ribosomal protein L37AE/L43A